MISLAGIVEQNREVAAQVLARIGMLAESSRFILGAEVEEFERAFAGFVGAGHAIGVASGTDALTLSLRACGIGPGDEVVLPTNTFIATAEAVVQVGATPVLVDADPDGFNMGIAALGAALTERTRAVIPVHLFGRPMDVEAVDELVAGRDIVVIEDACQAHGASIRGRAAGTLGRMAAFSFYPGKNLGGWGDGGAVVTDDAELALRVRQLRSHGEAAKYQHVTSGYCSRLDGVQAAALSVKLPHLAAWNARRREIAQLYDEAFADAATTGPDDAYHLRVLSSKGDPDIISANHLYVVCVGDRDGLREHLSAHGIESGVHYPVPIHLTQAFSHLGHVKGEMPRAEELADTILSLPIHAHMSDEDARSVISAVIAFTSKGGD